jgi:hypothetical protein
MNVLDFKQEIIDIGFHSSGNSNVFVRKMSCYKILLDIENNKASFKYSAYHKSFICVDDNISAEERLYIEMQNPNNTIKTFSQIIWQMKVFL